MRAEEALAKAWRPFLILALVLGLAKSGSGFLIQTFDGAAGLVQQVWKRTEKGIPFIIHSAGSDDLPAETTYQILRQSFQIWENVPTAHIRFTDQGLTSSLQPSTEDGRNLLIFDESGRWLAPRSTGVIAFTHINSSSFTGEILDADIVFNGRDFRFSNGSSGPRGSLNLKDIAVHEIGHLLGLDHTPLDGPPETRPTMNPFNRGDGPGATQTLEPDDLAGVSVLYPTPAFLAGEASIAGQIADVRNTPLFGTHVVAENLDTGALYSTLSGAFPRAGNKGHYVLRGLSAGSYRLLLTPVQGAITEDNFGGIFEDFVTNFPEEFYDNAERPAQAQIIPLRAGQQVIGVDFTTGFIRPGFPFVSIQSELANTPNTQGPYIARFQVANATQVVLFYRNEDSGLTNRLPMSQTSPGTYSAAIPGQPIGTRISYQVQALNDQGNSTFYPSQDQWLNFAIVELSGSPLAFIAVREEDVVSVIDTGSERELARILVGDDPIQVLLALDGHKLFVSNLGSSEIVVIETANFQVLNRLDVAAQPLDMALSPDGRTLYVTNSGASSLTAIDIASGEATTFPLDRVGRGPYGVAVSGDSQTIYVTDLADNQVIALDSMGRVVDQIPVADQPRSLALSPDGRKLYATSFASNRLTIIDATRNQVSNSISLPVSGTFAVAPSPDGRKVYLTAHDDAMVVIVDAVSESLLKTLPIGTDPRAISFSPDGDQAFITSATSDEIFVISTSEDVIVGTYSLGKGPRGIAITPSPLPLSPTAVTANASLPSVFALNPGFPNPFNASTQITYTIPGPAGADSQVQLGVFNVRGQKVRTLIHQPQSTGKHAVKWDGKDGRGTDLASGVYLVFLRTPGRQTVQKILLLR